MPFIDKEFLELDPAAKTIEWATREVTQFRTYWKRLVDLETAEEGMAIILSKMDLSNVKSMFKDPTKFAALFIPLCIMEKVRNILIGEHLQAGINVNLNALDPAADEMRENDKKLLQNRGELEELISHLQQSIGGPEYKLESEESVSGNKVFNGNVALFDKLGLDPKLGYQVSYFFEAWHQLFNEMDMQKVINYCFETNEVSKNLIMQVNDVMAKRALAMQAYVNEITGAFDIKPIAPETVWILAGKRADGKDATAIGYDVEMLTISQLIKRIGNEFIPELHFPYLLNSINYYHAKQYTGIWDGDSFIHGYGRRDQPWTFCHYGDFMNYKVGLGYIEWKSWEARVRKTGMDFHGNFREYEKTLNALNTESTEETKYQTEPNLYEYTYRAFFVPTSTNTQLLFKFGKLSYQAIEGAEDEFSNYSIFIQKGIGPTIAQVAKPWIEIAQECFAKMRWNIRKAKPSGRSYNYDSLVKIGKHLIGANDNLTNVSGVIKMFEEGVNELYTTQTTAAGGAVGGGQNPHYDLPNGLDRTTVSFQSIVDWAVNNIKEDIAMNNIRESQDIKPNLGYKLQMQSMNASKNATFYIGDMIDNLHMDAAKYCLITMQDALQYNATLPYEWIRKNILGDAGIARIKALGKRAFHRFGIFLNGFNSFEKRRQVMQDVYEAWQKGEIPYEVKLLLDEIDDYRKAAYILAFEKAKADQKKQQEIQVAHQNQMEIEAAKRQTEMLKIDAEGEWRYKEREVQGYWWYKAALAQADSRRQIKQDAIDNEPEKQALRTQEHLKLEAGKRALERQDPLK